MLTEYQLIELAKLLAQCAGTDAGRIQRLSHCDGLTFRAQDFQIPSQPSESRQGGHESSQKTGGNLLFPKDLFPADVQFPSAIISSRNW